MTPSGIDPATFQFVAQCLNHCATSSVPRALRVGCFFVEEGDYYIFIQISSKMQQYLVM
jgi:hypothetical protein